MLANINDCKPHGWLFRPLNIIEEKMVEIGPKNIADSIKIIDSYLTNAYNHFMQSMHIRRDVFNESELISEHYMEKAFISTLVFLEVHSLNETYKKVDKLYIQAKKDGLLCIVSKESGQI